MTQRTFPTRRFAAAPSSPDAWIRAVAARQWDLVTTAQILAAGLTDGTISRRVARGALYRRHRGVYSLGPAPLSREAQWMAATLAAGPVTGLSHEAATELHGVNRLRAMSIDVVTLRRRRIAVEAAVRDCMQRANGRHNLHVVERAIELYRGGSAGLRSRGERAFLALVTRHGLPKPTSATRSCGSAMRTCWSAPITCLPACR